MCCNFLKQKKKYFKAALQVNREKWNVFLCGYCEPTLNYFFLPLLPICFLKNNNTLWSLPAEKNATFVVSMAARQWADGALRSKKKKKSNNFYARQLSCCAWKCRAVQRPVERCRKMQTCYIFMYHSAPQPTAVRKCKWGT